MEIPELPVSGFSRSRSEMEGSKFQSDSQMRDSMDVYGGSTGTANGIPAKRQFLGRVGTDRRLSAAAGEELTFAHAQWKLRFRGIQH